MNLDTGLDLIEIERTDRSEPPDARHPMHTTVGDHHVRPCSAGAVEVSCRRDVCTSTRGEYLLLVGQEIACCCLAHPHQVAEVGHQGVRVDRGGRSWSAPGRPRSTSPAEHGRVTPVTRRERTSPPRQDRGRGRALTGRAATRIIDPCARTRPVATCFGALSPGRRLSARSALDASPRWLGRSTRGASASGSSRRCATARTGARHSSRSGSPAYYCSSASSLSYGFDAEHRRGRVERVVRLCHRQEPRSGSRRCPVRGPTRVDRIESYWGSEMEAPAFSPENVAELGCSASAHTVSGSRSRRARRADPVHAGTCWPKSSHCAGFSIVGSMLARQSQLEGIVAGGEPITIAISSPFFRTMVEIGWV
jgi:hypothetical protein